MSVNSEKTVWLLNDGRAGHWRQVRALAAYLPAVTKEIPVQLKIPWRWAAPRSLPGGLAMHPGIRGATAGAAPSAIISCGRHGALAALWLQRNQGPRCRTVQILHCGLAPERFNWVIAPAHDGLSAVNVMQSLGSLNPVDENWLSVAATETKMFGTLPGPNLTVLLGGPARHFDFSRDWFSSCLAQLAAHVGGQQGSLILVGSPRTPAWVAAIIEAMAADVPRYWLPWRPQQRTECERQYVSALAHADGLAVTADSVNLVSEASASGKPVTLIGRPRARGRVGRFCDSMVSAGYCQPLENADYSALQPTACLRETEKIAHRLLRSGLFA